jgi:mannan endo-1,4-beta-mannosidase
MKRVMLGVASALVGMTALSGCTFNPVSTVKHAAAPAPAQTMPQSLADSCGKPAGGRYIGLSVPHTSQIVPTEKTFGITANVVSLYYAMGQPIDINTIDDLCAEHIMPIIELDTDSMPLSQITSGAEDGYLRNLALSLSTTQTPVGIDFNHEFNGSWYVWGYQNVKPAQFVAAWQRIVDIFRENGATNVTWIWNPNVAMNRARIDLQPWYPGDDYVTWVGLDGYFYSSNQNYSTVFDNTISQIRAFTKRPMIIMESGADPAAGRVAEITGLFQGAAKTPGMLGLIYFDYDKDPVHDWYINNDPSALAAFKSGAAAYLHSAG